MNTRFLRYASALALAGLVLTVPVVAQDAAPSGEVHYIHHFTSETEFQGLERVMALFQEHGFDLATIPYALQFNKRDIPNVLPVEEMYRTLNYKREPTFEAVATTGVGVFDTLKSVAKQILIELKKR